MPTPPDAPDLAHDLPALRPTVLAPAGARPRPRDLGIDLAEVITALLGLGDGAPGPYAGPGTR